MRSSRQDDGEHWRRRAEEMRAVAKDMLDPSKQTMLEIALGYERLAQMAEVREISNKDLTTSGGTHRSGRAPY
jgi:hypothetical protein